MVAEIALEKEKTEVEGRSPAQDAWREFRRNRVAVGGMAFIGFMVLIAFLAPLITPYDYSTQNTSVARAKPMTGYDITTAQAERCHWYGNSVLEWGCTLYIAGSDNLGRDLFSRTIYGTQISLAVAFVAASVSLVIGFVYGTVSGYLGGNVDNIMMRIVDFMYGVPTLPIIILMTFYFQSISRRGDATGLAGVLIELNQSMGGLLFLFIAIGALNWIGMARLARGQVLSYKQKEFIEAAHALGATDSQIIFKHLMPNIIGPLIIAESLAIPGYIFLEATLSFIGLGVNPPTPSWG